jgi:hypothetical protein
VETGQTGPDAGGHGVVPRVVPAHQLLGLLPEVLEIGHLHTYGWIQVGLALPAIADAPVRSERHFPFLASGLSTDVLTDMQPDVIVMS